ncbi:MAG: DNA-directed RNA polymerase subunit alpha [Gloeomargaritaceae cyanobacterium C42_A2020_066]|nr:DNA-directed RNA polymerase subunit alpha [Gloeomargaritaceae cyanobacterium C42_A2020_066]
MTSFQIECVESQMSDPRNLYGKFILEPLEPGQGTTVGNALRRVLLADLEGAAVTSVRIAGVTHEFSTVPGMREDVLELLLNLKELALRSYSPDPQVARLRVQGPLRVTAGNLELPADLEVVDEDQYIATLSAQGLLEMELRVERGRGYRMVDRTRDDLTTVDALQIDAIFMPVRRVSYSVDELRLGTQGPRDSLTLEVWTNGSYTPQESVSQAAATLVDLFTPLRYISRIEPADTTSVTEDDKVSQVPIEELQLSVRAYNCLKRAQIHSVADLMGYSQEDLLEIKNFGQKSAEEVIEALQKRLGIFLPKERPGKVSP